MLRHPFGGDKRQKQRKTAHGQSASRGLDGQVCDNLEAAEHHPDLKAGFRQICEFFK
jgi:hypothetical protein